MGCDKKVCGKCMGSSRYRRRCGLLRTLFCGERQRFNALVAEKKRRLRDNIELGMGA